VLESRLLAHHSVVDAAVVGIPDKELPSHQTMPNNI
jgi:acyl-coenzyme A synthetase/AMP-(fatty) acid ligase